MHEVAVLGAVEALHAGRTSAVLELRSHPLWKDTATGGRRNTSVLDQVGW